MNTNRSFRHRDRRLVVLTALALVAGQMVSSAASAQVITVSITPASGPQASPVTVVVRACDDQFPIDHEHAQFSLNGSMVMMQASEPDDRCTGWRWSAELTLVSGNNGFEANICDTNGSCSFPSRSWTCTNCLAETLRTEEDRSVARILPLPPEPLSGTHRLPLVPAPLSAILVDDLNPDCHEAFRSSRDSALGTRKPIPAVGC